MADTTTNKRSLWITIGAAAATIVVILGIAVGPSVLSCTGSSDGFGACMRQVLADTGIIGQPEEGATEVAAASQQSTEQPEPAAQTEATEEIAADEVAEAAAAAPRLGLVRAEPDGSLVIAGSAEPGSEVEIYANGELLGRTTTESSGDWVFVPDVPLPPGGFEITVSEPASGQLAAESVVVVIQDDLSTEPLVVASTPGEASQVLQGLTASEPDSRVAETEQTPAEETMEVAEVTPDEPTPSATPEDTAGTEPAEAPEAATRPEDAPVEEAPAGDVVAERTPSTDAPVEQAPAGDAPVEETPTGDTPARVASTGQTESDTPETETLEEAQAEPEAGIALMEPAGDAGEAATAATVTAAPMTPPTIDAIEVEGNRNFFAGSGEEGATVRLYVDNEFVADSVVNDGRWLVETSRNYLTSPNQRVRVDMLRPGGAEVAARAEVNFAIDRPDTTEAGPEPETAVADAGEAGTQADGGSDDQTAGEMDQPDSGTGPAETASAPDMAVAQVDEQENDTAVATEHDTAGTEQEAEPAGAEPGESTATAANGQGADDAAPETAMAGDMAAGETAGADAEADVPTMTAVQVGDEDDQRFASGKAIIRRGDNLWSIATRVYGSGYRYITIYRANRGQIRDPDLIYPGQVFELPEDGSEG